MLLVMLALEWHVVVSRHVDVDVDVDVKLLKTGSGCWAVDDHDPKGGNSCCLNYFQMATISK